MGSDASGPRTPKLFFEIATLLGTGLALLISVKSEALPRGFLWVTAGYLVFLLLIWAGPPLRARLATRASSRRTYRRIIARWPAFLAQVRELRELFTPAHSRSVQTLLQRMELPSTDGKESMLAHLDAVQRLIPLMDRLTVNVTRDAARAPPRRGPP